MTPDTPIPDREERLDEVLTAYLKAVDSGESPDRQAWVARYPELADDLTRFFRDADRVERWAGELGFAPGRHSGGSFGPYELLEEIGRGGMGVVYRARRTSSGEIVALKMIRASFADIEDLRRFRTEAAALVRLNHPNVVRVFEVSEHEGQPYLALEYLEGGSLARHLAGTPLLPRQAARLTSLLGEAVAAAHDAGIVHRDLKPANVLIAEVGRPLNSARQVNLGSEENLPSSLHTAIPKVADFGLARSLQGDSSRVTQTGAVLGTPSYMAPEQASGSSHMVGTEADIYAIGAILYEMITGRPPFKGPTPLETLRQVVHEDPVSPRRLNPSCPRELENLCLRCLEKDPRRRYSTAQALVEDVQRFLEGKPVRARSPGTIRKLARGCRRRPLVASLITTLFLVVVAGLSVVGLLWHQAEGHVRDAQNRWSEAEHLRGEVEHHLSEVETQRQRARAHFNQARQVLNDVVRRVNEADFAGLPGAQMPRKELLQMALGYYREFLKDSEGEAALRQELADAQFKVAQITSAIGSKPEALAAYGEARRLYEELVRQNPQTFGPRIDLAETYNNSGILLEWLGRKEEALEAYMTSVRLKEDLLREYPENPSVEDGLASTANNIGVLHLPVSEAQVARTWLDRARILREKLIEKYPNNRGNRSKLAGIYDNLATVTRQMGTRAEVYGLLERGRVLREQLCREAPDVSAWQVDLAHSLRLLAEHARQNGTLDEATNHIHKVIEILEPLARRDRDVTEYQVELAWAYQIAGMIARAKGDLERALTEQRKAVGIRTRLVALNPSVLAYQEDLSNSHFQVGVIHQAAKRGVEALEAYQQALVLREKLLQLQPDNDEFRQNFATALLNLGSIHNALNHSHEALKLLSRARTEAELCVAHWPEYAPYRLLLGSVHGTLAEIHRSMSQPGAAVESLREAALHFAGFPRELYLVARDLARTAELAAQGRPTPTPTDLNLKERCQAMALDNLQAAVRAGFRDAASCRKDPAFATMLERPEFQKILSSIGSTGSP